MSQIAKEDLDEINTLRNKLATVVSESGQISLQIQLLTSEVETLTVQLKEQTKTFKSLLDDEQTLIKRLSDKYGTGQIDFDTGEFTPEK
jgi:hypothetical protein